MTRAELMNMVFEQRTLQPELRLGQSLYHIAWAVPELHDKVSELHGGPNDPYYNDLAIEAFLDSLGLDS